MPRILLQARWSERAFPVDGASEAGMYGGQALWLEKQQCKGSRARNTFGKRHRAGWAGVHRDVGERVYTESTRCPGRDELRP